MSVVRRFDFIDCLRGIAIVLMILQHSTLVLMNLSLVDSTPYILMIILGIFSAPMFLMLVGFCLSLSAERRIEQGETRYQIREHDLRRGVVLTVFGFLLAIIWDGDILRYTGMFISITTLLLETQIKTRFIVGVAALVLSPMLKPFLVLAGSEPSGELFFQTSWNYSKFLYRIYGEGYLALFGLFAFVVFGTILGSLFVQSLREGREKAFQKTMLKLGLLLTGVGVPEIFLAISFDDFPAIEVICTMGVSLLVLSGLIWLEENKIRAFRILSPLILYGRLSLSIYVGHIVIWLGAFRLLNLTLTLSFPEVLIALLSGYILIWVLGSLWLKTKTAGPLELIIARFI